MPVVLLFATALVKFSTFAQRRMLFSLSFTASEYILQTLTRFSSIVQPAPTASCGQKISCSRKFTDFMNEAQKSFALSIPGFAPYCEKNGLKSRGASASVRSIASIITLTPFAINGDDSLTSGPLLISGVKYQP